MNKSELARSLDISRQMVYKLEKQGMPTNSLEAALTWRKKMLHPFMTKTGRICGNSGKSYLYKRSSSKLTDFNLNQTESTTIDHQLKT